MNKEQKRDMIKWFVENKIGKIYHIKLFNYTIVINISKLKNNCWLKD